MDITLVAAGAAVVGLVVALFLYKKNDSMEIEDKRVAEITQEIQDGAMAFLFAEYRILAGFVVVVACAWVARARSGQIKDRLPISWHMSERN